MQLHKNVLQVLRG